MTWHHHHVGDLELVEHFDIEDPDPMDVVHDDNILVHRHTEAHFDGKDPCEAGCVILAGEAV